MSRTGPVGIGLIGAGMISDQYLTNLIRYPDVRVVRVGDLDPDRAAAQAQKYGIPRSGTAESVLADDEVEIVINLTIPAAHVAVSTAALQAGKHVWSEKPIGIERDSAAGLVELAAEQDLLLGIAPDTVLGPLWQTAKRAIQAGVIGTPLSAVTSFQSQGPDWFTRAGVSVRQGRRTAVRHRAVLPLGARAAARPGRSGDRGRDEGARGAHHPHRSAGRHRVFRRGTHSHYGDQHLGRQQLGQPP